MIQVINVYVRQMANFGHETKNTRNNFAAWLRKKGGIRSCSKRVVDSRYSLKCYGHALAL